MNSPPLTLGLQCIPVYIVHPWSYFQYIFTFHLCTPYLCLSFSPSLHAPTYTNTYIYCHAVIDLWIVSSAAQPLSPLRGGPHTEKRLHFGPLMGWFSVIYFLAIRWHMENCAPAQPSSIPKQDLFGPAAGLLILGPGLERADRQVTLREINPCKVIHSWYNQTGDFPAVWSRPQFHGVSWT